MTPTQKTLTLTNEQPAKAFTLPSTMLANVPEVLEVWITKVNNPARTPVDIFVYLSSEGETDKSNNVKTLLGNFSLYPPDRSGKFLLNPTAATRKLAENGVKTENVQLLFELRRLDEKKPWTPVEITIAQPEWREKK